MNPKISIIIPIYNVEKYIEECLVSVFNQTYTNLEILCINDCSTDSTLQKLEQLKSADNRMRIINNEKNLGLARTRNRGIHETKGDYLYFLDSDDILPQNTIEKMLSYAQEENIDIVVGRLQAFTEEENKRFNRRAASMTNALSRFNKEVFQVSYENGIKFLSDIPCIACSKLYKTSFLAKNNLLFIEDKITHEDNGFFLKIFSALPKLYLINDICLKYRIRANSITANNGMKTNKSDKVKAITDAINYIQTEQKEHAKEILKIIHESKEYNPYILKWYQYLINITKHTKEYKISVFMIPVYKKKINRKNICIYYFLGLPLWFKKCA